jgi:single-strand DNA-binding protein
MNLNDVFFAGNLTKDPILRSTASGKAVVSISIASNRKYKDKQETCFLECTAWEKTAELIQQYYKKGNSIFVIGRLKQETWQDRETGKNRSKIILLINRLVFTDRVKPAVGDQTAPAVAAPQQPREEAQQAPQEDPQPLPEEMVPPDDPQPDDEIPF